MKIIVYILFIFVIQHVYSQPLLFNDKGLIPGINKSELNSITGWSDDFSPNTHKLGFLWSIYAVKAPLAWEITKGKYAITININESSWGESPEEQIPDVDLNITDLVRTTSYDQTKNFKYITYQNLFDFIKKCLFRHSNTKLWSGFSQW